MTPPRRAPPKAPEPDLDGFTERTLPHNLDAERAVIGAILVRNNAYDEAANLVKAKDFFRDAHRRIYEAIAYLRDERQAAIDHVTLSEELTRRGDLDAVGGKAYVVTLSDGVPRAINVSHYCTIVRDKAVLRELIYAANTILTDAYCAEEQPTTILERADRLILDASNAHTSGRLASVATSMAGLFADFERRVNTRGTLSGIPTGFASVDELTFGWQPGDLIVIAARPSVGKTTFVMNSAVAAARAGKHVAFFSLEMRRRQLEYRLLSSLAKVPCTRVMNGYVSSAEYPLIAHAFEELNTLPISIDDRAHQTVQDIRSACRRLKSEGKLDLVVVDYVQLMQGTIDRKGATRNEELTDISRRLKILTDEVGAPILLLSQLKRLAGRTPALDDLRESGALEQDSDIVGFLHRTNHRQGGATDFTLAKQRNGPTGSVRLAFDRDTLTFSDAGLAPESEPTEAEQPAMDGMEHRKKTYRRR